jgi:hypothetical protein
LKSAASGFLGFVLFTVATLCGGMESSRPVNVSTHQSRYVYCNVYLDYACFGITSGDALDMKIPADFVLYSISLGTEAKVQIYSGNNPQDDGLNSPLSKHCATTDPMGQCLYIKRGGIFDLLYQANAKASFIHIHLTGIKASNADDIKDFLSNFRDCKPVDQSIHCTDERIFKNVTL